MRRLLIGLVGAAAALALTGPSAHTQTGPPGPVDVFQVSGLIDPIVVNGIDEAIARSVSDGAQALVLQVNSRGAVVDRSEMESLLEHIAEAPLPIAVWVGPSGARLYGTPAQLLAVADVTGMAAGSRVGHTGVPLSPRGGSVDFGAAGSTLRTGSVGLAEARALGVFKQRISDQGLPTITNMIAALDGYEEGGRVLETSELRVLDDGTTGLDTTAIVRFSKLPLVDQLFHTAASPAITYLLFLAGLALVVFEFFTAGVGIAGVLGACCIVLSCSGLATLPSRGWAVGLIIAAMVAFAVDVQVGIPRFWTGVGVVLTTVGSVWLFEPLPGTTLRPSWITLIAGIGGVVLAFVVGMPSMVRARFATPTIGREWMIGEVGEAVESVDPDGLITVGGARWRARTNRATPVPAGQPVRVVAIDGVTLEVEPLEGAARDHRERRSGRDPRRANPSAR